MTAKSIGTGSVGERVLFWSKTLAWSYGAQYDMPTPEGRSFVGPFAATVVFVNIADKTMHLRVDYPTPSGSMVCEIVTGVPLWPDTRFAICESHSKSSYWTWPSS